MMQINATKKGNTISQDFKRWAIGKGVSYLKKGHPKEHVKCFWEEMGLLIRRRIAHGLIARIVHQRNLAFRKK